MKKSFIFLLFLMLGCAQTVSVKPAPVIFPDTLLAEWEGRNIQISILDYRPIDGAKVDVISSILGTLKQTNNKVIWQNISNPNLMKVDNPYLKIKVVNYESTFSLGNWSGHVKFDLETHKNKFTIEKFVTLSNLWGYKSGADALQKAFEQAMSELISKLQ